MKRAATSTTTPCLGRGGEITVDARRCPTLHRALSRGQAAEREGWQHVVDLRAAGKDDTADRVARRLLGIKGEPMTEEKKAELRAYNEAHREERAARRKQQAAIRRALSKPTGKRR